MSRMPSVGDVVDDVFRVDEELDHGNFGSVYKVTDLLEKRVLALKVLKPGPHDEEELHRRFEREARLIYSLHHPHVIEVFYYGDTESQLPYMAMEYLQGTDLKALLRHHGGLSEALARRITIESLSALHAAHDMGIIHRDLKPANIYLVDDGDKGHVKVLDFGFAKALEGDADHEITNAGTLVGTPAYMSPELVHKRDVGPAADLYAMGLILAEMLTGEKIVQVESIYDTVVFQGSEKPIKLPESLQGSDFYDVVERSVAKDLDRRYETAVEMIDALRELDLEGVGPYTEDVPLATAPPEVGSADPEASTRPRTDGRPSLEEIEDELDDEVGPHVADFGDNDPTIERSSSASSGSVKSLERGAASSGSMESLERGAASSGSVKSLERGAASSGSMESLERGAASSGSMESLERAGSNAGAPAHGAERQHRSHGPQATPDGRRAQPGRQRPPSDAHMGRGGERTATSTTSGPVQPAPPPADDGPSALRDVMIGIVVGGIVLSAILLWLTMM